MVNKIKQQESARYLIFNDASVLAHQGRLATGASVYIDRFRRTIDQIAMFNFGRSAESNHAIERRTVLEGLKLRQPYSVFAVFTDSQNSMNKFAFLSDFIDSEDHNTPSLAEADLLDSDMELFAQGVQKNPQTKFARVSRNFSLLKVADEFARRARDEVDMGSFSRPSVKVQSFPTATFLDIKLQNLGFSSEIADRAEQDFDDLMAELS